MQNQGIARLERVACAVRGKKALESCWDFLKLDDMLKPDERALRQRIRETLRQFVEQEMGEYLERTDLPTKVKDLLRPLNITGLYMKGYGCPGLSMMSSACAIFESFRADPSLGTYFLVQSGLGMSSIYALGSEEQKERFLPDLAGLKKDVCWGLTEPGYGSDASGLKSSAQPVEGGFLLNGTKRWIGNATHAGVLIIFARNTETKKIQGFILTAGMKGLSTRKIEGKWALRSVQNAEIYMEDVFVPANLALPKAQDFAKGANEVLKSSRIMVAWAACGTAAGAWDYMMKYLRGKTAMGKPIIQHQLVQEKITRALANVNAAILLAKRGLELFEKGQMTIGHAAMCKAWCSRIGRETVQLAREVMGGNGILLQNLVIKYLNDMEAIYTYEGTYDINILVAAREVTGLSAFK